METLTISKTLQIGVNKPDYKKWWVISFPGGSEAIIIRVKNVGSPGMTSSVQYTLHPYRRYSKKWKQRLWFRWLKVKVWIGDLYK